MRRNPETLKRIFGETFISTLEAQTLTIGKDHWTRQEIATRLGLTHTKACSILSAVAKELGARDTKHLYDQTTPYTFASTNNHVGVTTLYVLFAAFRDRDLNAEAWYRKGQTHAMVTFLRFKHRELEAARRTKKIKRAS